MKNKNIFIVISFIFMSTYFIFNMSYRITEIKADSNTTNNDVLQSKSTSNSTNLLINPNFTRTLNSSSIDGWMINVGPYHLGGTTSLGGLTSNYQWYSNWVESQNNSLIWFPIPDRKMGVISSSNQTTGVTILGAQKVKTIPNRKYSYSMTFEKTTSNVREFVMPETFIRAYNQDAYAGTSISNISYTNTTIVEDPYTYVINAVFNAQSEFTNLTFRLRYNGTEDKFSSNFYDAKFYEYGNDITVNYVNEFGKEIAPKKIVSGYVNDTYETSALAISGYTLKSTPINSTGTFSREDQTVTYTYKDTEPPKGVGKLTFIDKNDSNSIINATDYSKYLSSFSDNDTANTDLTFKLVTTSADIVNMVKQVQTSSFKISITDKSGNQSVIDIPVFVKDSQTVIASDSSYAIRSNNIDIKTTEYPKTEEDLKSYIKAKANSQLWQLFPNKQGVALDANLITIDISTVPVPGSFPTTGKYNVKLSYTTGSHNVATTIVMTVLEVKASLKVEFINEINQVLSGYTLTIPTVVGQSIDLTKNTNVINQISNIEKSGYDIAERPSDESAVAIKDTTVTVQYKLQGILSFSSIPNIIDFGTIKYDATTKRVENPTLDKQLTITDTRADATNGWSLTASLSTPMRNNSGQELVNALRYVKQGKETVLSKDAQVIYNNTKGTAGNYIVSNEWGTSGNSDGIKLQINSSDTVYTGDYVGVITWKVMAGQP